ncbi:multidrug transporter [Skermanella stibiiresistens SB22]|uniref:Multidrug transporter n=1 Tax=Skermanella stibiiresistens SB22 TaxID=1385369 RepID=W9H3N5_9PROT|nr:DMT family transporter [Skermanella stibiiresistens]EWY38383.1 multidrug transporter [Skermanella stibiiresistens SB22]
MPPQILNGRSETLRGIGLLVLSLVVFAVMDVLIKWLSASFGTFQIIFFRSVFALLPLGVLVARSGGLKALRTSRPGGHVLRSLIGASALVCFFYAFSQMPLADVYAIHFAGPLFLTALSGPMLGEKVGWRRWSAVGVGFLGVVVMLQPGSAIFSPIALIPLLGAVFYAFAMIFVRKLSRTETNAAIVCYFTLTGVAVGSIGMALDWRTPDLGGFLLLAMVGILGGIAQILMTQAFRSAPAAILAPFEYTAMIWAVTFGYLVFADLPSSPVLLGALIVSASGLYILHRETRRERGPVTELSKVPAK